MLDVELDREWREPFFRVPVDGNDMGEESVGEIVRPDAGEAGETGALSSATSPFLDNDGGRVRVYGM